MKHLQTLESLKLWAIVPAAGSGSRFSKTELKQYQIIEEKTVLEHTIQRLNDLPLTGYVLAIGAQDDIAQKLPFRAFLSQCCMLVFQRLQIQVLDRTVL